jgi:hypothetical protein
VQSGFFFFGGNPSLMGKNGKNIGGKKSQQFEVPRMSGNGLKAHKYPGEDSHLEITRLLETPRGENITFFRNNYMVDL